MDRHLQEDGPTVRPQSAFSEASQKMYHTQNHPRLAVWRERSMAAKEGHSQPQAAAPFSVSESFED